MTLKSIEILQPDDWHVHLREGEMLEAVAKFSARINKRCIVMPNLKKPITSLEKGIAYKQKIKLTIKDKNFEPLLPCYLTEDINSTNFREALDKKVFIGAKLYPSNATTNSSFGVNNIEKIYPCLEILDEKQKPLLIHGEKSDKDIKYFEREKYFVDDELFKIRNKFPSLKIILEHVSSSHGANFVKENNNIAATITPHHMLLTSKDLYIDNKINPHNFCMPVVKDESDLIELRKCACSGNEKFFLGTDSAPHHLKEKNLNSVIKPGIFSAPCSIELYAEIFHQENSLHNFESFASINGPNFYNLPPNRKKIKLINKQWHLDEYTNYKEIKIKSKSILYFFI